VEATGGSQGATMREAVPGSETEKERDARDGWATGPAGAELKKDVCGPAAVSKTSSSKTSHPRRAKMTKKKRIESTMLKCVSDVE
jgi:hypothetical protein